MRLPFRTRSACGREAGFVCRWSALALLFGAQVALAAGAGSSDVVARAKSLASAGRVDRALALLAQTIEHDLGPSGRSAPVDIRTHRLYQDLFLRLGDRDVLRRRYLRLQRRRPTDLRLRCLVSRLLPLPADRKNELKLLVTLDETLLWAHLDLAELLAAGGDLEGALRHARAGARLVPDDPDPRNVVGHLQLQLGRTDAARASFAAALRLRADHPQVLYNLALVDLAEGRTDSAKRRLRQAIASKATFAEALNNLGLILARERRGAEAVGLLRRAIAARPGYGPAHNNLALALFRTGDLWGAKKHLERAKAAGFTPKPGFERALERDLQARKGWGKKDVRRPKKKATGRSKGL